jgi:hypothetical protein
MLSTPGQLAPVVVTVFERESSGVEISPTDFKGIVFAPEAIFSAGDTAVFPLLKVIAASTKSA